jgi:predicted secreted hydrolase
MSVRLALFCLGALVAQPCYAQGFAGMGAEVDGFANPDPGTALDFPADHGPHPDFRIEWWYLTANLTGPDGTPYGLQWTLFRTALAPGEAAGWQSPQIWFGHAAVTSADLHLTAERFARGGIGQAGVTADPFAAWIDDWAMAGPDFDTLRLNATGDSFAYDVTLTALGPLVVHGENGYSIKSEGGQASHYYSQPFFALDGVLRLPAGEVPVTGAAWLDREWSSQPLEGDQSGWDWFSLSFDDGTKLMGALVRDASGSFSFGTWIEPDGTATALAPGAFDAEPLAVTTVAGREVPTRWRVRLADRGLDAVVAALNPQAWMDMAVAYWEGPVTIDGSHTGRGYLEMTGY